MRRALCAIPYALIGAGLAACGNSNGPDARFACLGQSLPTTAPPTIVINGQVTDIVTQNPVSSAPVFAFRTGDTTSGRITTYAYPARPITRDTIDNISMVTPAEFSLLAAAAGITPQAGKGFIGVLVNDCTGAA